jgi:hypothetical protein
MTSGLPTRDELASVTMVHRASDLFSPPALTNFQGCVQVAGDPVALWNLNFPPLSCGDVESGRLFLDDWVFGASGQAVSHRWFPDRIERSATWRGLEVTSTAVLAWGATAAIVRFRVRNVSGANRGTRLGLGFLGSVAKSTTQWNHAMPPTEDPPNVLQDGMDHGRAAGSASVAVDRERGAVVFCAPSGAASVQGVVPPSRALDERGAWYELELRPGETWDGAYIHAVAEDAQAGRALYDRLAADVDGQVALAAREWDAEIEAAFTPGNDRYSGSLPILESDDPDLRRLYYIGAMGVIYFKRDSPYSAVGRAYDTLLPRYWATTTFIWDYSLSSLVHALLDPAAMRGQLERWMALDVHTCYGSDWLTGQPVGVWYSSNDHSMTQLIDTYLRWSGDSAWLDTELALPGASSTVRRQLERFATAWRELVSPNGLADYGGVNNLLECVSSYVHEVAALNAANVWNLRTAAGYLRTRDPAAAGRMEAEAEVLLDRLWDLYAEGQGWFNARMPDGRLLPVRHCYDLLVLLDLLAPEITPARRAEMVRYFQGQLQTPNWMRALSPVDPDAITSVRPDHQWNGAYTAWPAYVASGLYNIGRDDIAAPWLRGLAASANQGPFSQAHFVDDFVASESGGARKASSTWPYMPDWACSSGGAWTRLVIQGTFGVRATPDGLEAAPRLDALDPDARLVNLRYRDGLYVVDRNGVRPAR